MNKANVVPSLAAALVVALCATGCSSGKQQTPEPPAADAEMDVSAAADAKAAAVEAAEPVSGIVGDQLVTGTGTVMEVDVATRHILLENDQGRRFLVSCGEG